MKKHSSASIAAPSSLVDQIEKALYIPTDADYMQTPPTVITHFADDFSVLSCGCLISEQFAKQLAVPNTTFNCPSCFTKNVSLLAPVHQLRHLASIIKSSKLDLYNGDAVSDTSVDDSSRKLLLKNGSTTRRRSSSKRSSMATAQLNANSNISNINSGSKSTAASNGNISLLSAFHDILNEIHMPKPNLNVNTSSSNIPVKSMSISSQGSTLSRSPVTHHSFSKPGLNYSNGTKQLSESYNSTKMNKASLSNSEGTTSTADSMSPTTIVNGEQSPTNDSFLSDGIKTGSKQNLTSGSQNNNQFIQQLPKKANSQSNLTKGLLSGPVSSSPTETVYKVLTNHSKKSASKEKDRDAINKELYYAKNFPFYRKIYQYNTHSSKFLFRKGASKNLINTSISPDLTKLAMLSEKKWEVFQIDPEKPDIAPKLLCCGDSKWSYGPDFDNLTYMNAEDILFRSNFEHNTASTDLLQSWEHLFVKVKNNLLIISGTLGFLQIHDLNSNGKILYTYQSKFPIRCIDITDNENLISIGVTGKDKYTGVEQPFIILLNLEFISMNESNLIVHDDLNTMIEKDEAKTNEFGLPVEPLLNGNSLFEGLLNTTTSLTQCEVGGDKILNITTFPFALPYRDPVNVLQFSPSCDYLVCSTALESRFVVIDITDVRRPCLVMKSQRNLDTSLESEGITDVQFFPDNRTMALTSVAYNAVPIIVDSKITKINGPEAVARPRLIAKVEEIGNNTHKACVSPRGDSVAYLDRNGSVYLLTAPRMDENDNKRIVLLTNVASAYRARESASMRFDKNGYKLFIIDRKGVLTIADFAAGTTEDHSITRSKLIT